VIDRGNANDEIVHQWTLDDPNSVGTVTYDNKWVSVESEALDPLDIQFKPDGTRMFISDASSDFYYQYDLTIPWEVGTAVYNSVSLFWGASSPTAEGITWAPDGSRFWVADVFRDWLRQYTPTTAWDLSSVTNNGRTDVDFFDSEDGDPRDFYMNPNGIQAFMLGDVNNSIFEYSLTEPYDILTGTFEATGVSFSFGTELNLPSGFYFHHSGGKFWILDRTGTIYQYSMDGWDLGSASYDDVSYDTSLDVPGIITGDLHLSMVLSPTIVPVVGDCTLTTAAPTLIESDHKTFTPGSATCTLTTAAPDRLVDFPIGFADPSTNIQLFPFTAECVVAENTGITPLSTALQCFSFAPESVIVDNPIIPEPDTGTCTLTTSAPTMINESEDPDVTIPVGDCVMTTGIPIINAWVKQTPTINKTYTKQAPAADETWTACTSPTIAATYTKVIPS